MGRLRQPVDPARQPVRKAGAEEERRREHPERDRGECPVLACEVQALDGLEDLGPRYIAEITHRGPVERDRLEDCFGGLFRTPDELVALRVEEHQARVDGDRGQADGLAQELEPAAPIIREPRPVAFAPVAFRERADERLKPLFVGPVHVVQEAAVEAPAEYQVAGEGERGGAAGDGEK